MRPFCIICENFESFPLPASFFVDLALPTCTILLLQEVGEVGITGKSSIFVMASTLVLVVVFVLDLIAFSLAVAAEQRRSSVSTVFFNYFFPLSCFIFYLVLDHACGFGFDVLLCEVYVNFMQICRLFSWA